MELQLFDRRLEDLARKSDIAEVKTEIAGLRTVIAEVNADLIKTLLYGLVAVTAIFSAIVKLF